MTVGVLMVNWNGWRDTVAAYESLKRSSFQDWKLFVVDNASSDDSLEQLRIQAPEAVLIPSADNRGFAGGCNLAIDAATADGVSHLFFLNNDATVSPGALDALIAASASLGEAAALGGVVRFQPSGDLQFFGSRTSPLSGGPDWYRAPADQGKLDQPLIETDYIFGAAMFVPAGVMQRVGGFDERFFLNFEETDWCYRARRLGVPRRVVRDAVVFHKSGASIGASDGPMQTYFMGRNRLLFSERHGSPRQLARTYALALRRLIKAISPVLRGRSMGLSSQAFALAVRDYVLRRFGDCPDAIRQMARQHRLETQ